MKRFQLINRGFKFNLCRYIVADGVKLRGANRFRSGIVTAEAEAWGSI